MRRTRDAAVLAVCAALLAACGGTAAGAGAGSGSGSGSAPPSDELSGPADATLTVYNAQHQELLEQLVPQFTADTGITVAMRHGSDTELGNQIVAEGAASPADVFLTENSPAMALVDRAGLLATVDAATTAAVPQRYRPADDDWVGFAARSTVLAYNREQLPEDQLPRSILDLAQPQWKGRIGFAAGGADFQAIVAAVLALEGEEVTRAWLQGLADNGTVYQGNVAVLQAVDSGEIAAGIIYHYYWYRDRLESQANSANTELEYFGGQDPGAFVSVSAAGVLASTDAAAEAQQLVRWLTGKRGQRLLAESYAQEYAVANGVASSTALPPLDSLEPPDVDLSALDGPKVVQLMQDVGLL